MGIAAYFNNMASSLVVDGHVIAAAEEERFNRIKQGRRYNLPIALTDLPIDSIQYCLNEGNLTIDDIDRVAYGFSPAKRVDFSLNDRETLDRDPLSFHMNVLDYVVPALNQPRISYCLKKRLNGKREPVVEFVDHHLAHACSAFLVSGFDRSMVFVNDGSGEQDCITAYTGEGIKLERIFHVPKKHTLGLIYQRGTKLLGFKGFQDEYKTMGLAPYGEPVYFEDFISQTREVDGILEIQDGLLGTPNMARLTGVKRRSKGEPFTTEHKNFAASLQKFTEYAIEFYIKNLRERFDSENLCMAGGVALNAVANEKLRKYYKHVFVQPAANDAGSALGAALHIAGRLERGFQNKRLPNYFLGPSYSDDMIRRLLDMAKIDHSRVERPDLYHEIADRLSGGKTVAWFQGRMEYGPRALGNRSILANPSVKDMKDRLNSAIKFREGFRPFAPSILKEHYSEYFEGNPEGREHMLFVCHVKPDKVDQIPAVVHADGTARAQTVDRASNLDFYNLIDAFREKTGLPLLVNTSFNVNDWSTLKGKPIVMSPEQALGDFFTSGLDTLVMGSYIVNKPR